MPALGSEAAKRIRYEQAYFAMESIISACPNVVTMDLALHTPRPFREEDYADFDDDNDNMQTDIAQYQAVLSKAKFSNLEALALCMSPLRACGILYSFPI